MRSAPLLSLCLLLAGCAGAPPLPREWSASLTGYQQVPGPGDVGGTGTATFRLEGETQFCWDVYVRGIDADTLQLHRGAAGTAGPVVLELTRPDAGGRSQGCAPIPAGTAQDIMTRAFEFYVDAHNPAYPQGAIRGQLRGSLMGPGPQQVVRPFG